MNINVSLLNLPFTSWSSYLHDCKKAGITDIHFDIMDGHFVPVISFGHHFLKNLCQQKFKCHGHFMVEMKQWSYDKIRDFLSFYLPFLKTFIFHYEGLTEQQIYFLQKYLTDQNLSFGLAIKKQTKWQEVKKYLPLINFLIFMTVSVGFSGQKMTSSKLIEIQEILNYQKRHQLSFMLQIDGGVNFDNYHYLKKIGCQNVVIGSYLHQDLMMKMKKLKKHK